MTTDLSTDAQNRPAQRDRKTTLTAENGEPISVTTHRPASDKPLGAVLIAPAMATKARYYTPLAEWLVQQGFVVYRFDYQGYGESARTPLKEVKADILTWAQDAAVVVDWVSDDAGELPLTWIGHSLGGQVLPFVDHTRLASAMIVACGTGYWKHSEGINRVLAPALWYAVAPGLIRLFGYYPGRKIKLLGDLPPQVMRQWAKWCKHPDYVIGVFPEYRRTFAEVTIPMTSISFTDDRTMSAAATAQLENFYTGAELTRDRFEPAGLEAESIDHFGFFRRGREDLWDRVLLPRIFAAAETPREQA